jgi:putative DNA primase/helicase
VYLPVGNTWHHPRIFTLHLGRSSLGRKGDSLSLIHRIWREIEESDDSHADSMRTLGQLHKGGLSSREGLAWLIRDPENLGKKNEDAGVPDKRLWIVESEFANILHQARRDGKTPAAWNGAERRGRFTAQPILP